jgi:hypothetical protein
MEGGFATAATTSVLVISFATACWEPNTQSLSISFQNVTKHDAKIPDVTVPAMLKYLQATCSFPES